MIIQGVAPGSVSCNAVRVVSTLTSMRGFVTSKRADTIFRTIAEAQRYIEGADRCHPGLETHIIYDEREVGS